jgi:hypothetical protein
MQSLAARFRERRLAGFNHRKSYYAGICQAVGRIASHLGGSWPDGYEGVLAGAVAGDSRLECLYVLADSGVQLTETVCNSYKLSRSDSALFRPAAKGADLSLKDYYLLVKAGLPRYISDPYISRATGNLCVTVSQPFRGKGGENLIVCADFDCETA